MILQTSKLFCHFIIIAFISICCSNKKISNNEVGKTSRDSCNRNDTKDSILYYNQYFYIVKSDSITFEKTKIGNSLFFKDSTVLNVINDKVNIPNTKIFIEGFCDATYVYAGNLYNNYLVKEYNLTEAGILSKAPYTFFISDKKKDTLIAEDPVLSIDRDYFYCLTTNFGMGGIPNGIHVYKNYNNIFSEIFTYSQNNWIPLDAKWKNNTEILLKVIPVNKYYVSNQSDYFEYLKLIIK